MPIVAFLLGAMFGATLGVFLLALLISGARG